MNISTTRHNPGPYLKSPAEVARMEENTQLLQALFRALNPFVVPGTTGIRVQEFCLSWLARHGLQPVLHGYRDFPGDVCISINEVAAHGIPDLKPLQAGDLLTVDVAARRNGFHCDAAWTWLVPGTVSPTLQSLVHGAWTVCREALIAGAASRRISAIGARAQAHARMLGLHILPRFAGHGIGRALHEEPVFAFLGRAGGEDHLPAGTVLNIEPVVCRGEPVVQLQKDQWSWSCPPGTLSAQFELSLALLPDGKWRVLNMPQEEFLAALKPPFGI